MLSPRAHAVLIVAASTVVATTISILAIYLADLVLPDFTARFDNYVFATVIPIAVAPLIVLPLVHANRRLTQMQTELERRVRTDDLTGLPNRSAFFERAEMLTDSDCTPVSVMMVDIDHFKQTNDTYGHAAGDDLLRQAAHLIRNAVDGGDEHSQNLVARVGGEEFAVVLCGLAAPDAAGVADGICRRIRNASFYHRGEPLGATVSIGLAMHSAGQSLEATLRSADKAVYESKRDGRDRWTLSGATDGLQQVLQAAQKPRLDRDKSRAA